MRRDTDDTLRFSPSDLITYLQGEFAAWMERAHAERPDDPAFPKSDPDDPEMALIRSKGLEHEAAVLQTLEARHGKAEQLSFGAPASDTLTAMQAGKPLIYQGRLDDGLWHGYPDFLVRTDTPSRLGAWAYQPLDAKLARSPKPYFLIQLCAYAQYLEAVQTSRPARLGVLLGTGEERSFDTDRFFYFYRHLRDTFFKFQEAFDPNAQPDPALESTWDRWETAALDILERRDDLRLTARITHSQIKRLRNAGISTRAALVQSTGHIEKISDDVLARLRRQARLQVASKGREKPAFETLPHAASQRVGLALLPPPSAGDVFFDLEGNPIAKDGLEYLWGAVTVKNGQPEFQDWWAHNEAEEKVAFEQVVDWIHARLVRDPNMHVYHYANYEVNALCRLMGKYATRENAVDDLLRGDVLVDLYNVTRNGVAIGTSGYSLKDIEVLFAPERTALVTDAASSTVEYNRWLVSGEPADWRASPILNAIREYNREDCEFTWRLAEWLRERQGEAGIAHVPQILPEFDSSKRPRAEEMLAEQLVGTARDDVTKLVGWLLGYHRREDKPMWQCYFQRLEATPEDLYDDPECLANVRRTGRAPTKVKRSWLVEFEFDANQDTKLQKGSPVYVLDGTQDPPKREIGSIDLDNGRVEVLFGPTSPIPDVCHLIPNDYINSNILRDALERFGEGWRDGDQDRYRAVVTLLHRRPPLFKSGHQGQLLPTTPKFPDDLTSLIRDLDRTTLCIQGPPGAGKTHNAAAVIVALASAGKRVGVSSNSHKAIINLLQAVGDEARRQSRPLAIYKAGDETARELGRRITLCTSKDVETISEAEGVVVGGSAWAFARAGLDQRFDYLFIDEAGQVCLANAVAMSLSARNVVLIGDQMQLSQPAQAVHPGKSGWSCLHYFLEGHATVPPDLGVLLPTTWRLHPEICRFISDTAYEGRLEPDATTSLRWVNPPSNAKLLIRGTGLLLDEIDHDGNIQSSEEEADRIAEYVGELSRATVRHEDGTDQPFDIEKNLLLVTPYNAQVRLLKERLKDPRIRIASVDKFQGQQASVVILSMCASSLEETARGPKFLLNPNRLNVALSRAQCLAIVVASSKLVRTRPNSVEEMELFNLYCRLRYYAQELRSPALQGA